MDTVDIIKIASASINFLLIVVTGNIPLRVKSFKENPKVISLSTAFAGGLFLSVGIAHLLPEANESFEDYYESLGDDKEHFAWANWIAIAVFCLFLFIDKVLFDAHSHGNSDSISDGHNSQLELSPNDPRTNPKLRDNQVNFINKADDTTAIEKEAPNDLWLAPFILQIAIGIHAVFEGMAIGIEDSTGSCLSVALAVIFHKWAEGLTLGIAFAKAKTNLKLATFMIFLQAALNPIGVVVGWILDNEGTLIRGIFLSVSVGTFLYVAAGELIAEEFQLKRYKYTKFFFFVLAFAFISCINLVELMTGG